MDYLKSVKNDMAKFKKTKKLVLRWIAIVMISVAVALAAYFAWSWHRTNVLTAQANGIESRTTSLTTVLEGIRKPHVPPPAPAAGAGAGAGAGAAATATEASGIAGGWSRRGW
jgi:hypothetical protein